LRRSQRKDPRGAKRSPRHSSANVSSVHAVRSNRLAQGPLANILRRGAFDQRRSTPAFAPSTAPQSTEYRTCSALDGGKTRTSGLRPCNAKSRSRGASHGAAELQAPAQKQQCPGECPGFPFAAQAAASRLAISCLLRRQGGSTTAASASGGRHRRSRSGLRWAPLRLRSRFCSFS